MTVAQPIETAPKDGTSILIYIEDSWFEAAWDTEHPKHPNKWVTPWLPSHGCGCCAEPDPEPTYWAPLPEMGLSKELACELRQEMHKTAVDKPYREIDPRI